MSTQRSTVRVTATNKHLQDPAVRAAMIARSAKSSSAVEGIHAPFSEGDPTPVVTAKRDAARFPHR